VANSIRHQIMDAVIDALEAITTGGGYQTNVAYVSEVYQGYQELDLKKTPAVFPIDTDEQKRVDAIGVGTTDEMVSELTIACTCIVHDRTNDTRLKRTNLIRDVEKALMNNTALAALIEYIAPIDVVTDHGTIPNYSIWDQSFMITYIYDSTNGG